MSVTASAAAADSHEHRWALAGRWRLRLLPEAWRPWQEVYLCAVRGCEASRVAAS